jgi:predicted PurR-regulated permease PerM
MRTDQLTRSLKVIALVVLTGWLLYKAKPFLVPFVFAGLLAMLLLPLGQRMERKGWGRGISSLLSLLSLVAAVAIIIGLLSWQIADLAKNSSQIEQNITQKIQQLREYVTSSIGIPEAKQNEIIKKQQQASSGKVTSLITGAMAGAGSALTNIILVLVYIFLFLFYRDHLRNFVLRLVSREQEETARDIIRNGRKVAQKYLTGLALMIGSLWVMYGIGFSIAGVKNAIFFAVLCGLLEIIPFVGNLLGTAITVFAAVAQGGSTTLVLGILATYATVQFVQTYFLEPLVVGKEVNIHPMFTIIGLVAGEFIWGLPGMILAIPLLGITKIVCDHIPSLKPYGYLLGDEQQGEGYAKKLKGWIKEKLGRKKER